MQIGGGNKSSRKPATQPSKQASNSRLNLRRISLQYVS